MGLGGQRQAPPLYPPERPGIHFIGGWMDARAGLDGCGKSRPPPGFDPQTVQPVASRYTDYAIPVHPVQRVPAANYKAVKLQYLKIKCHCLKYFDVSS